MNVTIRWKDLDKSPAAESYLEEKIKKLDNFRFVHDDLKAEFIGFKDDSFSVKLNIGVDNSKTLSAESHGDNLQTCITVGVDKLLDQLRRFKDQHYHN